MNNPKYFLNKEIRTVWNEVDEMWYYVVNDAVQVFSNTPYPKDYIKNRRKLNKKFGQEWDQIITYLKTNTPSGRQTIKCTNAQGILRILLAIPSPNAEPLKMWLEKIAKKQLLEIKRAIRKNKKAIYQSSMKIYPDDWKRRYIIEKKEYAILTADVSKETFGLTTVEFKRIKKDLTKELPYPMTDFEYLLSIIGRASSQKFFFNVYSISKKVYKKPGKIKSNTKK